MSERVIDRSDSAASVSRRVMVIAFVLIYCPLLAFACFSTSFSAVQTARTTIATSMQRAASPLPPLPVVRTVAWKDIGAPRDPLPAAAKTPAFDGAVPQPAHPQRRR